MKKLFLAAGAALLLATSAAAADPFHGGPDRHGPPVWNRPAPGPRFDRGPGWHAPGGPGWRPGYQWRWHSWGWGWDAPPPVVEQPGCLFNVGPLHVCP